MSGNKTRVVNIYKENPDVLITRPGPFGNNHKIGFCQTCVVNHTRQEAINLFSDEFHTRIENDPVFRNLILELRGKKLGCCCVPLHCHGTVIVDYLESVLE